MDILRSVIIAFSMYSRIPVPRVTWSKGSMRFSLAFFPLVGAAEGLLFYAAWAVLSLPELHVPPMLRGAVLACFPFFYTGGIHMDGFMDTADALGSNRPRAEKLRILKDPHAGSFAVLSAGLYLILYYASVASLTSRAQILTLSFMFVFSRVLSAAALILLPNARGEGSAWTFSASSDRRFTVAALMLWGTLSFASLLVFCGKPGVTAVPAAAAVFFVYVRTALKEFGGVTGDLAGWFLCIAELAAAAAAAFFP